MKKIVKRLKKIVIIEKDCDKKDFDKSILIKKIVIKKLYVCNKMKSVVM